MPLLQFGLRAQVVGVVAANAMATDVAKVAFILCPKLKRSRAKVPNYLMMLPPLYLDFIGEQLAEWVGRSFKLRDYKVSWEEEE